MMKEITYLRAQVNDIIGAPSSLPPGFVSPTDAGARIAGFFDLFFIFATILATFFAIRGGIDYIMSAGEPQKIKAAQGALQYSIIGLIVCASGFLVVQIIAATLGYDTTTLNLPL